MLKIQVKRHYNDFSENINVVDFLSQRIDTRLYTSKLGKILTFYFCLLFFVLNIFLLRSLSFLFVLFLLILGGNSLSHKTLIILVSLRVHSHLLAILADLIPILGIILRVVAIIGIILDVLTLLLSIIISVNLVLFLAVKFPNFQDQVYGFFYALVNIPWL